MKRRQYLFGLSLALLSAGILSCNEIQSVQTGELSVLPEMVTFRSITPEESAITAQVEIRNVGQGRLTLAGVRIEEEDERTEIFLVDSDDLQSGRFLEPNEFEIVDLEWTPVDANPDQGRLIVTLGTGEEQSIALQTPDIDPYLRLEGDPPGMNSPDGLTLSFLDAAPNRFQRATLTLISQSLAPLSVTSICLLESEGECAAENRSGDFLLCQGDIASPADCAPLGLPEMALGRNDEFMLTIFFEAKAAALNNRQRRIQIESNGQDPSTFVTLVGKPCLESGQIDASCGEQAEVGQPGDACGADEECVTGYCIRGIDGEDICAEFCMEDEDCEENYVCRSVVDAEEGGVKICVPDFGTACDICESDSDCGLAFDRCVSIGLSNRCAVDCSLVVCSPGHRCQDQVIDGVTRALCIPDEDSCDPCFDPDGDEYGNEGECLGIDCNEEDPLINAGADEVCDGVDNDCNEVVDDAILDIYVPEDFSCNQVGVCAGTLPECSEAEWTCVPGEGYEPDAEMTCDGLDNDCDGSVDEAIEQPTADLSIGVCSGALKLCGAASGFLEPDYTEIVSYEADAELTCDGLDNDCDGITDEAIVPPTADLISGVCAGQVKVCQGEAGFQEPDYSLIVGYEPDNESICDGQDNDCDERVDENIALSPSDEQRGVCAGALKVCDGIRGQVEPNYTSINGFEAAELTCDGLDNDCDDSVDENVPLNLSDLQAGVCAGARKVCAGASGQVEPDYSQINTFEAVETTCDGLNNDCDMNVDEGITAPLADQQRGLCFGSRKVCNGVQGFGEPDYTQIGAYEVDESTCDGLNNDCDEATDENVVLPLSDEQRGVCFNARKVCAGVSGFIEPDYTQITGFSPNDSEGTACDGLDNDCDGIADEGITAPLADKQAGVCATTLKICGGFGGFVEPNYDDVNDYQPAETICDGLDNDCDEEIDETVAFDLADEQRGVCQGALKICGSELVEGIEVIRQVEPDYTNIASFEAVETTCDGLDNDCDGNVDEGVVPPSADLTDGVCAGQVKVCNGASSFGEPNYTAISTYEQGPDEVTCDGLDNDCDGVTDEGVPLNLADEQRGVCAGARKECDGVRGQVEPDYSTIDTYEFIDNSCDGLDNDCDGTRDESAIGPLADNQLGVCAGALKVCGTLTPDADVNGVVGTFIEPNYSQIPGYDADDLPGDNLDTNCDGIIGTLDRAVFVSNGGSDNNGGLTPQSPVASLSQAMFIVSTNPNRDHIYLEKGTYTGAQTITVSNGAKIYGGFDASFTIRQPNYLNTIIEISGATGFLVKDLTRETRIDDASILMTGNRGLNEPSFGIKLSNSNDHFSLNGVYLQTALGGDGTDGQNGANGGNASGTNGGVPSGGSGGNGGTGRTGRSGTSGSAGVRGGPNNGGGLGGSGGSGGSRADVWRWCEDDAEDGGNGNSGQNGAAGGSGASNNSQGSFDQLLNWQQPDPADGSNGRAGGGGGGGGAGGGCKRTFGGNFTGGDGGNGGGGGGYGTGGTGGRLGAPSVAVLMDNATINVGNTVLVVLQGGQGGNGGAGGNGGVGANGGGGSNDHTRGGNGGVGGSGGSGGCGAAGRGGASYGFWGITNAAVRRSGNANDTVGSNGLGGAAGVLGAGCPPWSVGSAGEARQYKNITLE